jgi:hypothetical protein
MMRIRRAAMSGQNQVIRAGSVSETSREEAGAGEAFASVEAANVVPLANVTPVAPIPRSIAWIATGAIASLLFIFVLGRGLTWSR